MKSPKQPTYDKTLVIGAHFGFTPIEAPRVLPRDVEAVKDCDDEDARVEEKKLFDPAEKAAFLRMYLERDFASLPHPIAVSFKKAKSREYCFELAGFQGGTAEALLIRTALSVLEDEGKKGLYVDLNSIGDKESVAAYERELQNYARKLGEELDQDLRKRIRKNAYEMLRVIEEGHALYDKMPRSIASLSSQSRAHFKEVMEHIEALGAEFRLLPTLVGNRHFCSETLFGVRDETNTLLAVGYRYSRLSKKLGFKKELPLAGVTVFSTQVEPQKTFKDLPRPKFYLVQLGKEAKLKTLPLIELLRGNRIGIRHSLGRDKITAQFTEAESSRVPYLLIMGQKEALEDSVTVRNAATRAQDTICIKDLPDYLKHLPI